MYKGVLPCLIASGISGLAGAITQKFLQGSNGKNSYLYSLQLSSFSVIYLSAAYAYNYHDENQPNILKTFVDDLQVIGLRGFIPITNQAMGGIMVGMVTKHAGSVRKGFALIVGIGITAFMQSIAYNKHLTTNQELGGLIVM